MTGSEFTGRQLAAGTIRGVRSFNVDTDGNLRGCTYTATWQPGENSATCYGGFSGAMSLAGFLHSASGGGAMDPHDLQPANTCGLGLDGCAHGFYAYYDGSDDYRRPDRVTAVIEGYGETLIGSRGFRSMKARILALHLPDPTGLRASARTRSVTVRVPGPVPSRIALWMYGVTAVLDAAVAGIAFVSGDWVGGLCWSAAAALLGTFWAFEARKPRSRTVTVPMVASPGRLPGEVLARIRARYPDVPVFPTVEAMLAAFPPDRDYAEAAA